MVPHIHPRARTSLTSCFFDFLLELLNCGVFHFIFARLKMKCATLQPMAIVLFVLLVGASSVSAQNDDAQADRILFSNRLLFGMPFRPGDCQRGTVFDARIRRCRALWICECNCVSKCSGGHPSLGFSSPKKTSARFLSQLRSNGFLT